MNKISQRLLILVLLSFHSLAFAALTDGLVAYWSFDDCTARDNSGNGHDGVLFGSSNQCIISSLNNKGFLFDGNNNYFKINTSQDSNIATNISYSFWINPKVYTGIVFRKWVNGAEDKSVFFMLMEKLVWRWV